MSFALKEYVRFIPFQISYSAFAFVFCLLSMLSRVKALSVLNNGDILAKFIALLSLFFFNYTSQNMVPSFHEIKLPQKLKYGI